MSARSAYLRSAMHQPVQWHEWSAEAFAKAVEQDKPILLDIGAVWCHWCHVMDRESYENVETASIINEHFIAIKVDRDERPDVDARYQAAVAAISGGGGWPLTAFLTPDGKPFFGGTYFPPVDGHGRPSLRRVLLTMAEAFMDKRGEVDESASSVMSAIENSEQFNEPVPDPGAELLGKLVESAIRQFDGRNGGFGAQPKFPNSGAIDLLIDTVHRLNDEGAKAVRLAATVSLEKMAKGGIHDHLAGGFHRYSVDEKWTVPHFEKMSYDNSELLKNYIHAYQSFREPEFARVARDIMRWMDEWLSDREQGGFYASQDADESLDDDGDYFTWTMDEAAAVLTPDEMAIAGRYFDIGEIGDMHHNPLKNTLHIDLGIETVAKQAGATVERALELLASAKPKLYAARKLRPTPYVDKTIYTPWNAMCISAYLEAGRVLEDSAATAFALKSLDRMLASAWKDGSMTHVVAYGEAVENGPRLAGGLEDYVFPGHAALDAWEATGELRYFDVALALGKAAIAKFYDAAGSAFFDTEAPAEDEVPLGALSVRRKPLQDSPTPAGNSVAAALLLRLEALTGREEFAAKAQATLECFAGVVEHLGLYAASYGLALQRMVQAPVQVCVIGSDELASELEKTALNRYAVNRSVVRLRQDQLGALPPSLAQTLPHLPETAESFAVVCSGFICMPPIASVERLAEVLAAGA
ncbi:thioredoxin domain-containing protein [Granulicella rosea]|nr:thioredoxin domain-containing protein [Granulicella rosea]